MWSKEVHRLFVCWPSRLGKTATIIQLMPIGLHRRFENKTKNKKNKNKKIKKTENVLEVKLINH